MIIKDVIDVCNDIQNIKNETINNMNYSKVIKAIQCLVIESDWFEMVQLEEILDMQYNDIYHQLDRLENEGFIKSIKANGLSKFASNRVIDSKIKLFNNL